MIWEGRRFRLQMDRAIDVYNADGAIAVVPLSHKLKIRNRLVVVVNRDLNIIKGFYSKGEINSK